MARQKTVLESVGAEFLVLGNLLIEGIPASKSYTNFPGYDIIAYNPDRSKTCRIQVKSRWATNYNRGFPIRNFDCDFVVVAELNRGYRHGYTARIRSGDSGRKPPEYYVLPIDVVKQIWNPESRFGIASLRKLEDPKAYKASWNLIREFVEAASTHLDGGQV